MRYNADKAGYLGAFLTALSLVGCEKNGVQEVMPSQLETAVSAQAVQKVEPELDLSTPEAPVKYYFEALRDTDLKRGHVLYLEISHEKELRKFEDWQKSVAEFKVFDASIGDSIEAGDHREVPVAMDYEKRGKRKKSAGPVDVVLIDGKWKLRSK